MIAPKSPKKMVAKKSASVCASIENLDEKHAKNREPASFIIFLLLLAKKVANWQTN